MIEPGWEQMGCPNCGSPERLGKRFEMAAERESGITKITLIEFSGSKSLPISVSVDCCNHCGTMYAYKCVEHKGLLNAASAS